VASLIAFGTLAKCILMIRFGISLNTGADRVFKSYEDRIRNIQPLFLLFEFLDFAPEKEERIQASTQLT